MSTLHGMLLHLLPPLRLGVLLLLLSLALPPCHCRIQKQPEKSSSDVRLPKWKVVLAVLVPVLLVAVVAGACCLHWRAIWRARRGSGKPNLRSVNGGMTRSDPTVASASRADAPAADDGPGQLGCAKRGQQAKETNLSRHGRTKATRLFDYDVVASAADGFSSSSSGELELGRSSSGTIVRGALVSEGLETPVAIKVFHHRFSEATTQHVLDDLKGQPLRHRNLLCPLGYCMSQRKLYVVYEYMVNGSLEQKLFPRKKSSPSQVLSWARRCRIIKGVAAGVHHLHSNGAVHGAIKASNVLLDQDMSARLGDFGYSRVVSWVSFKDSPYLAPECWQDTSVSVGPTWEMDIFYLGAVILEVVCGRKITNNRIPGAGFWFLVDWVGKLYGDGQILDAVDERLADDFNKVEAEKLLLLGLECSNVDPKQRPTAEDVVNTLAGSMSPPAPRVDEADE